MTEELTQKEKSTLQVVDKMNEEVYQKGNLDAIDELVAEDFQHHAPFPTPQGREGFKGFQTQFQQAFPDGYSTNQDIIVDGDRVAVRYTMRATHKGEFMDIPATNKDVEVEGISIYRVENGKIAEEWAQPDLMGLMQQMGVVQQPA